MHFPIATSVNNRYRGPVESVKVDSFYKDVEYNLNYLNETLSLLEEKTLEMDNIIKNKEYFKSQNSIDNIADFINEAR